MAAAERRHELRHEGGTTHLVVVDSGAEAGAALCDWVKGRDVHLVSSAPILELHGATVLAEPAAAAAGWQVHPVADGEAAKDLAVAEDLWRRLLAGGARRDSVVVTFGGGAVCDVGAFVAATFMRGIAVSHVPTTLLAQVDAAIGGKSAINLVNAKNVVGAFHQPERVVAATGLLATLPSRELRSGLVEVIKMAALLDLELLARVESELDPLLADPGGASWVEVVAAAQQAKAGVIGRDPRESGERRVLNFGHTLGHALEVDLGYGTLAHGEAVAWGMRFALELARERGLEPALGERLERLLVRLALPPLPRPDCDHLVRLLQHDKKADAGGVVWVLPAAGGRWEAARLPTEQVAAALESFVARHCAAC